MYFFTFFGGYTPTQWGNLPPSACPITPLPPWIYFPSENSISRSAKHKHICPELWLAENSFQTSSTLIHVSHFLREPFLPCTGLGEKQFKHHTHVSEMSSHVKVLYLNASSNIICLFNAFGVPSSFWWKIDTRRQWSVGSLGWKRKILNGI